MKKKIFVLIVMFSVVLPAFAAQWKELDWKTYLDLSSIKPYDDPNIADKEKYNRDEKEFWTKNLNDKSEAFAKLEKFYNKKMWFFLQMGIIDCNNKTLATKFISVYDISETMLSSSNVPDEKLVRQNITPGSRAEKYYNEVCR